MRLIAILCALSLTGCATAEYQAYAESLGVTGSAIFDLRSIIITGNNRLGVVTEVNLESQETINYVNMTTNVLFPDAFRLTTAEANTLLTTPAAPNEVQ